MCGIVGYIGKNEAKEYLLDGLETLEYRGYDSAGIATLDNDAINSRRVVGRVEHLRKEEKDSPLQGQIGIGHTRWATHGGVLQKNIHPHADNDSNFFVAHNGIIENHDEIRSFLQKNGYTFYSDTDTEVVPNLIAYHYKKTKNVIAAFQTALQSLRGAYALVMISAYDPGQVFAAKLSSPLAIGVSDDEILIGSDALPIVSRTKDIVFLEDGEMAVISTDGYKLTDIATKKAIERAKDNPNVDFVFADKNCSVGVFKFFNSVEEMNRVLG